MKIREIKAKSILSKSQVYDYALNPYVGCQHACVYCYAKFMRRFTGHKERWGEFLDIKINSMTGLPPVRMLHPSLGTLNRQV
jgi:DNA repair photolyase